MEQNIVSLGVDPKDSKPVQSIINEKEKEIHLFKKKLIITGTKHVQSGELIILQMEKDKQFQKMKNIKEHLEEFQKGNSNLKT